jgi:hypothetical protein
MQRGRRNKEVEVENKKKKFKLKYSLLTLPQYLVMSGELRP